MRWLTPTRVWRLTGRSGRAPIVTGCLRPSSPSWLMPSPLLAGPGHHCMSTDRSLPAPRHGSSDVDLLSIGLPDAAILGQRLSARYPGRCRGVEIAAEVADRPDSVITRQVTNGVAVRMAVLFLLLGSGIDVALT